MLQGIEVILLYGIVFIQPIGPRPRRPADGRELDAGPRFCRGTFDSAKEQ